MCIEIIIRIKLLYANSLADERHSCVLLLLLGLKKMKVGQPVGRYTPILPPMNRLRRHTVAPVDNIAIGLSRVHFNNKIYVPFSYIYTLQF